MTNPRTHRALGTTVLVLLWLGIATFTLTASPHAWTTASTSASPADMVTHAFSYTDDLSENSHAFTDSHDDKLAQHTLIHPAFFKNDGGQTSSLIIQNGDQPNVNYFLAFYSRDGTTAATQSGTLGAQQTIEVLAAEVDGLSVGAYSAVLATTARVHSVVRTADDATQSIALYRGIVSTAGGTATYFGPFYRHQSGAGGTTAADVRLSELVIANVSSQNTSIQAEFRDLNGTIATTATLPAAVSSVVTFTATGVAGLPDGFTGWVKVMADQPIVGLLVQSGLGDGLMHQPMLATRAVASTAQRQDDVVSAATIGTTDLSPQRVHKPLATVDAYLPRAFKRVDEGGGLRDTTLFFIDGAADSATGTTDTRLQLQYRAINQPVATTPVITLNKQGGAFVSLADRLLEGSPSETVSDGAYAVRAVSNQAIIWGEVTEYISPTTFVSGSYGSIEATSLYLPHLTRTDAAYTVFSIQNLGDGNATATITYTDREGNFVARNALTVSAGAALRINQKLTPALGDSFQGSAVVVADQPIKAWVDEYVDTEASNPTRPAPFSVQIDGPTIGMADEPLTFTAAISPTTTPPIGYGWQTTILSQQRTFGNDITSTATITWTQSGIHVLTATAAASAGEDSAEHEVHIGAARVTVSATVGASLVYSRNNVMTTVAIPAGAESATSALIYVPVKQAARHTFDLLSPDQRGQPVPRRFQKPVQVTVDFAADSRLAKDALALIMWTGTAWEDTLADCPQLAGQVASRTPDQLTAYVCQTGRYALLEATQRVYVPLIAR